MLLLKEVAEACGYNRTTVSLVLNNHPKAQKLRPSTREFIRETARKLNYQPNAAALALVTQRTSSIGIVLPDYIEGQWCNDYYATMLNGANRACMDAHYNLLSFCCNTEGLEDFIFPRGLSSRSVDGVLICSDIEADILNHLSAMEMPYVRLGIGFDDDRVAAGVPVFSPNIVHGIMLAIEYLWRLKHRRIAIANTGSYNAKILANKVDAAIAHSHMSGEVYLQHYLLDGGECDSSSGSIILARYFNTAADNRPTAMITNPQTCLGLLREMTRHKMHCPADMSLISNYDFDVLEYTTPCITSLAYENSQLAFDACAELIRATRNRGSPLQISSRYDFPASLSVRDSCSHLDNAH